MDTEQTTTTFLLSFLLKISNFLNKNLSDNYVNVLKPLKYQILYISFIGCSNSTTRI